jgi:hypothetical protein
MTESTQTAKRIFPVIGNEPGKGRRVFIGGLELLQRMGPDRIIQEALVQPGDCAVFRSTTPAEDFLEVDGTLDFMYRVTAEGGETRFASVPATQVPGASNLYVLDVRNITYTAPIERRLAPRVDYQPGGVSAIRAQPFCPDNMVRGQVFE